MKYAIALFLFLSITCLQAQSIDFNASGTSLTFSQISGGRFVTASYPVAQVYYTYDQQFNRVSIYYNASPRILIFVGALNELTIAGRTTNNEKLLELNTRLGGTTGGGGVSQAASVSVNTANSKNIVLSDTTVSITDVAYWCVCNVGTLNATLTFSGSPPTPLLPGMCVYESGTYNDADRRYYLPSAATIIVPANTFVQLISRPR